MTVLNKSTQVVLSAFLALGMMSIAQFQSVNAQDPDVREIPPLFILMLDSSGSMEYMPECGGAGSGEVLPTCSGAFPGINQKNRWTRVVEALTGTFSGDYYCTQWGTKLRTHASMSSTDPDYNYFIPHYKVRDFDATFTQTNNGILDVFRDRVKFGLMTSDPVYSFTDVSSVFMPRDAFISRISDVEGSFGGYSFPGAAGVYPGGEEYTFPGCGTPMMVNAGARNSDVTTPGRSISVGTDADKLMTNDAIQAQILNMRPYGGSPIDAMLVDLKRYLSVSPDITGDPYITCNLRKVYAILITDGYEDDMVRRLTDCERTGFNCPYDLAHETAGELCSKVGSNCTGALDGLFVLNMGLPSTAGYLDQISDDGGTTTSRSICSATAGGTDENTNVYASISGILSSLQAGVTTRTQPAVVTTASSRLATTVSGGVTVADFSQQGQVQISSGFKIDSDASDGENVWQGHLYSTSYICGTGNTITVTPSTPPLPSADDGTGGYYYDLGEQLNDRITSARTILVPLRTEYASVPRTNLELTGVLSNLTSSSPYAAGLPTSGPESISTLTGSKINVSLQPLPVSNPTGVVNDWMDTIFSLGPTDGAAKDLILNRIHAGAGSGREDKRLADIYHSNPVTVGVPLAPTTDAGYEAFKKRVSNRPNVAYVGTNDGLLHAFVTDLYSSGGAGSLVSDGKTLRAGDELWAIMPTALFPQAPGLTTSHQFGVDGTAVVRDVIFKRLSDGSAPQDDYHTVLLIGMRGGGSQYMALDVTNPVIDAAATPPTGPKFLWQFSAYNSGLAYGRPGLSTVAVALDDDSDSNTPGVLQQRAVAILPGGLGVINPSGGSYPNYGTCGANDGRYDSYQFFPDATNGSLIGRNGTPRVRSRFRCWQNQGRRLDVVDVATGAVIRSWGSYGAYPMPDRKNARIPAPIVGGVSVLNSEIGKEGTKAFTTDANGVVWRLDMSNPDPKEWTFLPFFDPWWTKSNHPTTLPPFLPPPSYEPAVLSVDKAGDTVLIQGTGNIDALEAVGENVVYSIKEFRRAVSVSGVEVIEHMAVLNWGFNLQNEQVMGPIELFNKTVYFSTFKSEDLSTSCNLSSTRLWTVGFIERGTALETGGNNALIDPWEWEDPRNPSNTLVGNPMGVGVPDGPGDTELHYTESLSNTVIVGATLAQRPTCITSTYTSDPYIGSVPQISSASPGKFVILANRKSQNIAAHGAIENIEIELTKPTSYTQLLDLSFDDQHR